MNDLSAVILHLASSPGLGIIRTFSFSFNLSRTLTPFFSVLLRFITHLSSSSDVSSPSTHYWIFCLWQQSKTTLLYFSFFILFSWFCFGSLSSLCLFVKRFDVCSSSGPAFDSLCLIAGGPVPHMLTLSWWGTHLDMIFECCVYRKACLLNTEWSLVKFRLRVKRQSPSTPFQQKISWIIHICSCAGEKNWWRTAGQSRMCVCVWRGYLGWQCCSTFSTSREKLSYHEPLLFTRS